MTELDVYLTRGEFEAFVRGVPVERDDGDELRLRVFPPRDPAVRRRLAARGILPFPDVEGDLFADDREEGDA